MERDVWSGLLFVQVSVLRTENDLKIILTERFAWSGLLFGQVSVLRTENDLEIIPTERFARSVLRRLTALCASDAGARALCRRRQAYSSKT